MIYSNLNLINKYNEKQSKFSQLIKKIKYKKVGKNNY